MVDKPNQERVGGRRNRSEIQSRRSLLHECPSDGTGESAPTASSTPKISLVSEQRSTSCVGICLDARDPQFAFLGAIAGVIKSISQKCRSGGGYVCSAYQGRSWSFLPDTGGVTSLVAVNTITSFENENSWEPTGRVAAGMASTVVFILVIQSVLTVGLHCAEFLVNMSRDEYAWRGTYTKGGYKPEYSLITVLTSQKSLFLLMLKPLIH